MKKILLMLIAGLLLIGVNVFANDVSIDSDGNVTTGVSNPNANLEVIGASGEDAIQGSASGTGGAGVYGENATSGDYGILGYTDGVDYYGVYGHSPSGYAGYFLGNARITGNLMLDGSLIGPTMGDITGVTAGTGLTGGGLSGDITIDADPTYLQRRVTGTCASGYSIRNINEDGTVACEFDNYVTVITNTNYVPKWDGSALVTGSIYDNGNISIGGPPSGYKLDVAGDARVQGPDGFNDSGETATIYYGDGNHYIRGIFAGGLNINSWNGSNDPITFSFNGIERMRLNNTGNVGIGTSVTGSKLTVAGTIESTSGGVKFPDGSIQVRAMSNYAGVAIVAKSGGDYTDPVAAMADITNWCGAPSSTSPCLMKIMPGVYDIGGNSLVVPGYVDLEGSGENVTKITGRVDSASLTSGLLMNTGNTEIRFLTVENINSNIAIAIFNNTFDEPVKMINVTAIASGGVESYGIQNFSSESFITNVTVTTSGGGYNASVHNWYGSTVMTNVKIIASGGTTNHGIYSYFAGVEMALVTVYAWGGNDSAGIYNNNSDPSMNNVTASASGGINNHGIYNLAADPYMYNVKANASGGDYSYGIYNNWDSYFGTLSHPVMNNVRAYGSGGSIENYGVYNKFSTAKMTNIIASASGGNKTYGVYNGNSSNSILTNAILEASDASIYNYGFFNVSNGLVTLRDSTISATGGSGSFAAFNANTGGDVRIDRSTVIATNSSVRNDSGSDYFIGASKLGGPLTGSFTCVNVYNDSYSAITCP
jgi:hypothetical protein